MYYHKIRSQ